MSAVHTRCSSEFQCAPNAPKVTVVPSPKVSPDCIKGQSWLPLFLVNLPQHHLLSSHHICPPYLGHHGQYPFSLPSATSSRHSSSPCQKRKSRIPEKPCAVQTRVSKISRVGDTSLHCVYSRSPQLRRSCALSWMWCRKVRSSFMSALLLQYQSRVEDKVKKRWVDFRGRGTSITNWLFREQCWDGSSLRTEKLIRLDRLPQFVFGSCYRLSGIGYWLVQEIYITSGTKWHQFQFSTIRYTL